MSETIAPAPALAEPQKFTHQSLVTFELAGPVAFAVTLRIAVEFIAPGRYRLGDPIEADPEGLKAFATYAKLSEFIQFAEPDSSIAVVPEFPPADVCAAIFSSVEPTPKHRVVVHGLRGASTGVARAIDARLTVTSIGMNRFNVTGRTQRIAAWLATWRQTPIAEALTLLGVTAEQAAEEDNPKPDAPPISIALPTREISSAITRDRDGNILEVKQTERSV